MNDDQQRDLAHIRDRVKTQEEDADKMTPDEYYNLRGTCKGCRRVTWLCRRDRKCGRYATTVQHGYIARPTGYQKANAASDLSRREPR